ncbi:hypothetical protein [Salinibacillus xinjiangensis]|uniref:hypothetical protein n=1 Tax=Salinibacillus xinjiangensis TaxID=1229268 RepID=UPI00129BF34C
MTSLAVPVLATEKEGQISKQEQQQMINVPVEEHLPMHRKTLWQHSKKVWA